MRADSEGLIRIHEGASEEAQLFSGGTTRGSGASSSSSSSHTRG